MRFGHFFVDRPIFASVLSILIILIGATAYLGLPVAQYPEIAPPTVQVTASYPGASAEVVSDTVSTPLEQEITVSRACSTWSARRPPTASCR